MLDTLAGRCLGEVDGARVLGAHNDLTKVMRVEQELLRLNETLEQRVALRTAELEESYREKLRLLDRLQQAQKSESLAVLAGGIAHDFNNLLVGVLGNAGLALELLPANAEVRRFIEAIETAGERAAELTREMLAYSGRGQIQKQRFSLNELIEGTIQLLASAISKNARMSLQLSPGLPELFGDITQIRQVTMNLITNASEAIGEESGVISIATRAVTLQPDDLSRENFESEMTPGRYVKLEVSDSGCGMDAETRSRIFDPFFTTKFTGRGLGLAATQGIVRAHSGAIQVDSEIGRGTIFRLLLPAVEGAPMATRDREEPAADEVEPSSVLIIDDEPQVRELAGVALERRGYRVVLAEDGLAAMKIFQNRPTEFSCVILDLTMPNLNGEETYRQLRAIRPELPAVVMSGFDESQAMVSFDGERVAFLQKPFKPRQLAEAVERLLHGP